MNIKTDEKESLSYKNFTRLCTKRVKGKSCKEVIVMIKKTILKKLLKTGKVRLTTGKLKTLKRNAHKRT